MLTENLKLPDKPKLKEKLIWPDAPRFGVRGLRWACLHVAVPLSLELEPEFNENLLKLTNLYQNVVDMTGCVFERGLPA